MWYRSLQMLLVKGYLVVLTFAAVLLMLWPSQLGMGSTRLLSFLLQHPYRGTTLLTYVAFCCGRCLDAPGVQVGRRALVMTNDTTIPRPRISMPSDVVVSSCLTRL